MDFITQMIAYRDRLSTESDNYGLPNVKSFAIRRRSHSGELEVFEYTEITPQPAITYGSPQKSRIANFNQIAPVQVDFEIKGISRKYEYTDLVSPNIDYIVGGIFDSSGTLLEGVECSYVSITENTTTWDMQLVRKLGDRQIY